MCTHGIATTCSSHMLENFVPPYTATAAQKLLDAGAVLVGKSNMDEFAMGSSTENSAFFPTHNPWAADRVPGGSSGGSAAAVAAGETLIALGSDTGGSIRQPASFCGIVGIKPTYGTVSRYGLIAFASSLDQIGPLTSNVTDAALTLNTIAGYDAMDSTSIQREAPDYTRALIPDVRGMKIGVIREMFREGVAPQVRDTVLAAARVLEEAGAIVDWDVSLPLTQYALPVYYILAPSEASSNLARYDGVKYGYSWDGIGGHVGGDGADTAAWLRAGGEAAHPAGGVRAFVRLLRCLLSQGAAGSHVDSARVRGRVHALRCAAVAHVADAAIRHGRTHERSASHVPGGYLHDSGQHRGSAGDQLALRVCGWAARRVAVDWAVVGGGGHYPGRLYV